MRITEPTLRSEDDVGGAGGARAGRDRAAEGDTGGCRRARLARPAAPRDRRDRARRTPRLRDRFCVRGSRRSRSGRPISAPSSGSRRAPTASRSCSRARRSSSTQRRPASERLSTSSTSTRATTTASSTSALLARSLGMGGKICIHPAQVAVVNRVFAPDEAQLDWARRVVAAYEAGVGEGRGAVALDGEMIDLPVVVRARRLLEKERSDDRCTTETEAAPKLWRGRFYEDFERRRRVPEPPRTHDHRDGQHLVHAADPEHEPDALQHALHRGHAVRTAAGQLRVHARPRHRHDRSRTRARTRPRTSPGRTSSCRSPVFVGDTLWAESEITDMRESKSNPNVGIVSMRCRGINQRREVVIEFTADVHGLQARSTGGDGHVPGNRRGLDGLRWRLQQNGSRSGRPAFATTTSRPRSCEAAKLHLLDTLGCGLAAARAGRRDRGPHDDGRARRRRAGDRDRLGRRAAGRERGVRERDALPRARLRRHALRLRQPRLDGYLPGGARRGRGAGRVRARGADRDRRRETRSSRGSGWPPPASSTARGFHPTAICGIFGAVTAAARLDGLDARTATSALGLVGSMASGLFAYLEDGTPTKPLHPAWAAHGALIAARLAALGAEGPPSLVEGKFGLYHAFLGAEKGAIDVGPQLADLGSRWETPRIAYKPYPACHFMHGSLGATSQAAGGRTFSAEEIEDVVVTVPAAGVSLVLEPADAKVAPRARTTRGSSRSSTRRPRCSSAAASASPTTPTRRSPTRPCSRSPRKVRYETRDYPTYPQAFPGGVRVRLADGTALEADFPYQKGGPENPLSPTRCARSSAATRRSRSPTTRSRPSRRRFWRSRSTTTCGPRSHRSPPPGVAVA